MSKRYLVLRVPNSGPNALIAEPNDFDNLHAAEARIAAINGEHLMVHHTYLEVFAYSGDKFATLDAEGIIY